MGNQKAPFGLEQFFMPPNVPIVTGKFSIVCGFRIIASKGV